MIGSFCRQMAGKEDRKPRCSVKKRSERNRRLCLAPRPMPDRRFCTTPSTWAYGLTHEMSFRFSGSYARTVFTIARKYR
jgi:hypothetical protein